MKKGDWFGGLHVTLEQFLDMMRLNVNSKDRQTDRQTHTHTHTHTYTQ